MESQTEDLLRSTAKPRWRHVKRGTVYTELAKAELQMSGTLVDGATMVIYQGDDGRIWVREIGEFTDGRFVPTDGERLPR